MAHSTVRVIQLLELWNGLGDTGRAVAYDVLANDTQIADAYDAIAIRPAFRVKSERAFLLGKITTFIALARTFA